VLFIYWQILAANQQACRLFEGPRSELVGQKLSTVLRKTSQVLDTALSERCLRADGSVAAVCGKVVCVCVELAHLISLIDPTSPRVLCPSQLFLVWRSLFALSKVDAVTLSGDVPVSVWAQRQLQDEQQQHQHWLIVMEQVERISASVSLAQDVIGFFYFIPQYADDDLFFNWHNTPTIDSHQSYCI